MNNKKDNCKRKDKNAEKTLSKKQSTEAVLNCFAKSNSDADIFL